ncbi:MAG: hypothetical protein U0Z26_10035 [Anaerolineales bacterium]
MKRLLLSILILLTACSSPQTPASFFNPTPDTPTLNLSSTSEQIQQAMLQSATQWTQIRADGTITWYDASGTQPTLTYHEQVWIDQLTPRFRSMLSPNNGQNSLKISDGQKIYSVNERTGSTETIDLPQSARVGQYVPPLQDGVAYPNPLWGQIGTPLSEIMFSSSFAQNKGTFKALTLETVAGREALVVEWTFIENTSPSFKVWLDTSTSVILKIQEFGKEGGQSLQSERVVNQIAYNESFDASLFTVSPTTSQMATSTQVESIPVVTEAGSGSDKDAGELYFFLQPRQAGQSIQLAKVSGVCVYDANCPPMEIVKVPFAFNFTLEPLSWSPDGKHAAFSYSDHPNGTPTKLWLLDATAGTWTSLAEFPYIDPPFWSPDGSRIAFRTQDGLGGEDVYVVRRDGSELKSISTNLPVSGKPYIMDGWYTENIIMRSALPGSNGSIYLVRASDGVARPVFETMLTKAQFVTSPDSSLLLYDDYATDAQMHFIKVMEPDGANTVTLASLTGGSIYPTVWSPNSQLVAFNYYSTTNDGQPKADVYAVGRDGKKLSLVYSGMTIGRMIFSPNGRYLLVEETNSPTGGHLFIIDLATLQQKILQAPGLSMDYDWYAPSWRP